MTYLTSYFHVKIVLIYSYFRKAFFFIYSTLNHGYFPRCTSTLMLSKQEKFALIMNGLWRGSFKYTKTDVRALTNCSP